MKQFNLSPCRFVLLAIAALLFSTDLPAQIKKITGKVIDNATGAPLDGVTLSTKNATVITNNMGEYTLAVDKGDKLQVTYIGYQPQAVKIGDNDIINVPLLPSTIQLNDVVVTALGIRKEVKRLGYAVQEVKGEDLVRARDQNPISGLTGK